MRLLPIRSCQPGMKLAKPIYNEEGIILLGQSVELSQTLIRRLVQLGVDFVYVEDHFTADVAAKEPITDETKRRALAEIRANFQHVLQDSTHRKIPTNHHFGKAFRSIITNIIDDIGQNQNAMIMLMNINVAEKYLFQHSLNVCIYSMVLGMAYGYTNEELTNLGVSALLHDIGKSMIDIKMLKKTSKLTPEEMIELQKHTEIGYRLLKDEPNIPLVAADCAFQHHERMDGSGYPRGIKGDEIHEYAKWIAIVDSYDALTSRRSHRYAKLPHEALDILISGSGNLYDPKKVSLFRDQVAIYPLGMKVSLSTGEKGVVTNILSAFPQRPIVRVMQDAYEQKLSQPYEVDLSKDLTVMITSVAEE